MRSRRRTGTPLSRAQTRAQRITDMLRQRAEAAERRALRMHGHTRVPEINTGDDIIRLVKKYVREDVLHVRYDNAELGKQVRAMSVPVFSLLLRLRSPTYPLLDGLPLSPVVHTDSAAALYPLGVRIALHSNELPHTFYETLWTSTEDVETTVASSIRGQLLSVACTLDNPSFDLREYTRDKA